MAQGVKTYDPKNVYVIFGGIPIGGFTTDNGISVSRNSDTFETIRGIGGVVSRKKKLDQSGIIKLSLAQTSLSNDVLSGFALLDEKVNSGILPFAILDVSSKSVYLTAFAWVKRYVDAEYGSGLSARVWEIECPELQMYTGGITDSDNILNNVTQIFSR